MKFNEFSSAGISADAETKAAIRKVIGDWDGTNWEAVRAQLRNMNASNDEIDSMTMFEIRMRFATMPPVLRFGKAYTATDSTITFDNGARSKGGQVASEVTKRRADDRAAKVRKRYTELKRDRNKGEMFIVSTLADEFACSESTIRNDLKG